ncbi:MAG: hypothetical protein EPO21_04070 [Chloroflexota bacterium]|nr:MAG: hypothetical protein EPO21_04070 [Chloroflexota bacterium]
MTKRLGFILACVALLIGSIACQSSSSPAASTAPDLQLRIGLLPIVDVLPIYVADAEGYFKEQKLDVQLTLFSSAMERDSAFQTAQIEGELNDLVSVGLLNKDGERAKVVRTTYRGNAKQAMISVLAAPGSKIQKPADLKGVQIGLSGNTVMEYATDRLLRASGLGAGEFQTTEVTKIPVRAEMLAKGQIQAATMPEPFASVAVQQGARVVIDDQRTAQNQSVMTFRQDVVEKHSDEVRRFLAAYEKAVQVINEKPESYRNLLIDKAMIPESVRQSLAMPVYPRAAVPNREEVTDVVDWMAGKGMLSQKLSYERIVNGQLLPK